MKSYLHQLQSDRSAMLLMYLSDELPPKDRARVQEMIASDPAMAAELDELTRCMHSSMETVRIVESQSPPLPTEAAAVRQVARLIHQRKLRHQATPVKVVEVRRFPRWVYLSPTAAAAALVLFALWTVYRSPPASYVRERPHTNEPVRGPDRQMQALLLQSFEVSNADDADNLQMVSAAITNDDLDFDLESPRSSEATHP